MSCIYIGNLSYRARERDVEYFFRGYGRTYGISLKNGYGFIEFEDYRDADDAVYELNGKELCGERVSLEHSRGTPHGRDRDRLYSRGGGGGGGGRDRDSRGPRGAGGGGRGGRGGAPPIRTEHRLLVENLSSRCNWKDLKDLMREAGDVMYADCHRTRTGEGIVEFSSRDDMKRALKKLDGEEINGKRIKLVEDVPRRSSCRSRSGSRSRSRSRSPRSRSRSGSRRRSKSHSRSRSRSRRSGSRSRTRSPEQKKSASRSRSRTRSKSRSRSHSGGKDELVNGEENVNGNIADEVKDTHEDNLDDNEEDN